MRASVERTAYRCSIAWPKPCGSGAWSMKWRTRKRKFRNWTNPASQIRNPKYQIGLSVQLEISDFGFEMQDSSNFKIPLEYVTTISAPSGPERGQVLPSFSVSRFDG